MKGQFEVSPEMIYNLKMSESEVVRLMLDQQLKMIDVSEAQRLITGWYARRTVPYSFNKQYMWDVNIHHKINNPKYLKYLDGLKSDGWEIAFKY